MARKPHLTAPLSFSPAGTQYRRCHQGKTDANGDEIETFIIEEA